MSAVGAFRVLLSFNLGFVAPRAALGPGVADLDDLPRTQPPPRGLPFGVDVMVFCFVFGALLDAASPWDVAEALL